LERGGCRSSSSLKNRIGGTKKERTWRLFWLKSFHEVKLTIPTKEQLQGFVDFMVTSIPLGRVGTTDEIAKAVVFLASDDSSFVNGIELFVDGGMAQI
jgi:NAD(P)-dependent dehydrogenase (short-subunit alcohol dehydrogenase family)